MFGSANFKVRERLLHKGNLTLSGTLELCHAVEMTQAQHKVLGDNTDSSVSLVRNPEKMAKVSLQRS